MIAVALFAAAYASASDAMPKLTIPELVDRHAELNGHWVEVSGWMGKCRPLGCVIYADPKSARTGEDMQDHRNYLSIAAVDHAFDAKAVGLYGKAVALRGRFDDGCFSRQMICLDRVADIKPADAKSLMPLKDR